MKRRATQKRGRPQKFGRPAELVTLTLPRDAIEWLSTIDDDLAWAVVKLHERAVRRSSARQIELAGLFQVPGNRALILVRPDHFQKLRGVSLIPLADGRAFLALDPTKGVVDLEVAVVDRLASRQVGEAERDALTRLRDLLQAWRLQGIHFESRSIVIARRPSGPGQSRPLSALKQRRP